MPGASSNSSITQLLRLGGNPSTIGNYRCENCPKVEGYDCLGSNNEAATNRMYAPDRSSHPHVTVATVAMECTPQGGKQHFMALIGRWRQDGGKNNTNNISVEESLVLGRAVYKPVALLCHRGKTRQSGHYYTVVVWTTLQAFGRPGMIQLGYCAAIDIPLLISSHL